MKKEFDFESPVLCKKCKEPLSKTNGKDGYHEISINTKGQVKETAYCGEHYGARK